MREGKPVLRYSDHVRYVEQLRRYHQLFGHEQVLVLIYDDFRSDNEACVRQGAAFPGRQRHDARTGRRGQSEHPRSFDAARRSRAPRKARSARAQGQDHRSHGPSQRGAHGAATRRPGQAQPVNEQLTLELRRRFKGEVCALADYMERDLVSEWGYADLD